MQENGAFAERGEVHHKAMQGGAAEGGVPLTAYVYAALLENGVGLVKLNIGCVFWDLCELLQ